MFASPMGIDRPSSRKKIKAFFLAVDNTFPEVDE